jgi:hypothetical protein
MELSPEDVQRIEDALKAMDEEYRRLADSLPDIADIPEVVVPVPEVINADNVFVDQNEFRNFGPDNQVGMLQKLSDKMFHPTQDRLADQCFSMNDFLTAFILPRLVHYRDTAPGFTLYFTEDELKNDWDGCIRRDREFLDFIIKGFWIATNVTNRTEEQSQHWYKARLMFAENWDRFWC